MLLDYKRLVHTYMSIQIGIMCTCMHKAIYYYNYYYAVPAALCEHITDKLWTLIDLHSNPFSFQPPLDYITYIGCSISFVCLIGAIIFFLSLRLAKMWIILISDDSMQSFNNLFCFFYRKELVQKLHNFVHLNLCIALALGLLVFLTGVQTATANVVSCKVITHQQQWCITV